MLGGVSLNNLSVAKVWEQITEMIILNIKLLLQLGIIIRKVYFRIT